MNHRVAKRTVAVGQGEGRAFACFVHRVEIVFVEAEPELFAVVQKGPHRRRECVEPCGSVVVRRIFSDGVAEKSLAFGRDADAALTVVGYPADAVVGHCAVGGGTGAGRNALEHRVVGVEALVGANPDAARRILVETGGVVALQSAVVAAEDAALQTVVNIQTVFGGKPDEVLAVLQDGIDGVLRQSVIDVDGAKRTVGGTALRLCRECGAEEEAEQKGGVLSAAHRFSGCCRRCGGQCRGLRRGASGGPSGRRRLLPALHPPLGWGC